MRPQTLYIILFALLASNVIMAQKVGINTDTPLFDLDIRGTNDTLDGGELQLTTPSQTNFLRFFGGRLGDHHPFMAFSDDDTFHIVTTLPDWSTYTRRLTILPSGHVGINIETPVAELDIRPDHVNSGAFYNLGNVANTHFLRLYSGSSTYPGPALYWPDGVAFRIGTDQSGFTEKMRITSTGFVGIGTVNPLNRLDVRRDGIVDSGTIVLGLISDVSNRPILQFSEWETALPNSGMAIEYDGTGANVLNILGTDALPKFTFTTTGKLGIGTENPGELLEVGGSGRVFIGDGNGANKKGLLIDAVEPGNYVRLHPFNYGTNTALNLYLPSDVIIGTTTPASGYKLSVAGRIMAEEVRVQLQSNWPDYVFDSNYALLSPDLLEKEIQLLGHLPGIPSADELQRTGLHIGEMQTMMMEKIEELTLYIIQQHKEIEQLKLQVSALQQ